jgi:hypothetical protein
MCWYLTIIQFKEMPHNTCLHSDATFMVPSMIPCPPHLYLATFFHIWYKIQFSWFLFTSLYLLILFFILSCYWQRFPATTHLLTPNLSELGVELQELY